MPMSLAAPANNNGLLFREVIGRILVLDSSTSNTGGLCVAQGPEGISLKCDIGRSNVSAEASNLDSHPRESSTRSKSSLPCGIGEEKDLRWTGVFIPTFLTYVGALPDAWKMKGAPAVKALQLIWDSVYHDRPYTIDGLKDPVYLTVSRNLVLWVDNSNIFTGTGSPEDI